MGGHGWVCDQLSTMAGSRAVNGFALIRSQHNLIARLLRKDANASRVRALGVDVLEVVSDRFFWRKSFTSCKGRCGNVVGAKQVCFCFI